MLHSGCTKIWVASSNPAFSKNCIWYSWTVIIPHVISQHLYHITLVPQSYPTELCGGCVRRGGVHIVEFDKSNCPSTIHKKNTKITQFLIGSWLWWDLYVKLLRKQSKHTQNLVEQPISFFFVRNVRHTRKCANLNRSISSIRLQLYTF